MSPARIHLYLIIFITQPAFDFLKRWTPWQERTRTAHCEICWVWYLGQQDPHPKDDRNLRICLCWANLDAINSRASGAIKTHVNNVKSILSSCRELRWTLLFHPHGHFLINNQVGMSCAIDMLFKSIIAKGCISDHIQFDPLGCVHTPAVHLCITLLVSIHIMYA